MAKSDHTKEFIDEDPGRLAPDDEDFVILSESATESDLRYGVKYYARVVNIEPFGVFVSVAHHDNWDRFQGLVHKDYLIPFTAPDDYAEGDEILVALRDRQRDGKLRFKMVGVLDTLRDLSMSDIEISLPDPPEDHKEGEGKDTEIPERIRRGMTANPEPEIHMTQTQTVEQENEDSTDYEIEGAKYYYCPFCEEGEYRADHPFIVRAHVTYYHETRNGFLDDFDVPGADSDGNIVGYSDAPLGKPKDDWLDAYFGSNPNAKKDQILKVAVKHPGMNASKIAEESGTSKTYAYSVKNEELTPPGTGWRGGQDSDTHVCLCGEEYEAGAQLRGHKAQCEVWVEYKQLGYPDLGGEIWEVAPMEKDELLESVESGESAEPEPEPEPEPVESESADEMTYPVYLTMGQIKTLVRYGGLPEEISDAALESLANHR